MFENRGQSPAGLTASDPFVSAHGRAQIVVALFLAYIAVTLFAVASNLMQINLLSELIGGADVAQEQLDSNDQRQGIVALLTLLIFVLQVIAFLMWLHRVTKNVPALGNSRSGVEYSPRWAVGSFFIPFANLFMPYRAVKEVWEKSDPSIRTEDDIMFTPPSSAPLLLGWWFTWLAMNVLSRIATRFESDANTPETLRWVTWVHIIADVISIVSAALVIFIVRGIDQRQEERARNVTYIPQMPPPPPLFTSPSPPQSA